MADATAQTRVSVSGAAGSIDDVLTNLEDDVATDDTLTVKVGGVNGTTAEPCHGFVHVNVTVDGTGVDSAAAQTDAASELAGALSGHGIIAIPGVATVLADA